MNYVKCVVPLEGRRLFLELGSTSNLVVDLSIKLDTMKYMELQSEELFFDVKLEDDYVVWGDGRVKVTVQELIDVAMFGT